MSMKQTVIACAAVAALTLAATTAQAVTIFSQTPDYDNALSSDKAASSQVFDNVTLATTATARSVTWRGLYIYNRSPEFPLSFDLNFYADNGSNLPDLTNILSSTTVTFNSMSDVTQIGYAFPYGEYEFTANINPTLITAGTQVWFSAQADTSNDDNDVFYWITGFDNDAHAVSSGTFYGSQAFARNFGPFYFTLNDTADPSAVGPNSSSSAVPEPASMTLALLGLGGLAITTRRRRSA